jgi:hypothetical protein
MPITRQSLIDSLTAALPARAGAPSSTQYADAIDAAVLAYSQRVPLVRTTTLAVTAGVSSYSLPADFLALVSLESAEVLGLHVAITSAGIVPLGDAEDEVYEILGNTLVFDDAPTYSSERTLKYNAAHVATSGTYADMQTRDREPVLLRAQADLLRMLAMREAGNAWSYKIGDESVDKKGLGQALFMAADVIDRQYERIVDTLGGGAGSGGTVSVRSDYTAWK